MVTCGGYGLIIFWSHTISMSICTACRRYKGSGTCDFRGYMFVTFLIIPFAGKSSNLCEIEASSCQRPEAVVETYEARTTC